MGQNTWKKWNNLVKKTSVLELILPQKKPFNFSKNEDDAKLSYEVAHRLILKLAEYVTEKAANPVKVWK